MQLASGVLWCVSFQGAPEFKQTAQWQVLSISGVTAVVSYDVMYHVVRVVSSIDGVVSLLNAPLP
jgi:hypothetical protein